MSISPFSARPAGPGSERSRLRLIAAIALLGIAATLLAYAISPGVRHAVHSVKRTVSGVLDHDRARQKAPPPPSVTTRPSRSPAVHGTSPQRQGSTGPAVTTGRTGVP